MQERKETKIVGPITVAYGGHQLLWAKGWIVVKHVGIYQAFGKRAGVRLMSVQIWRMGRREIKFICVKYRIQSLRLTPFPSAGGLRGLSQASSWPMSDRLPL